MLIGVIDRGSCRISDWIKPSAHCLDSRHTGLYSQLYAAWPTARGVRFLRAARPSRRRPNGVPAFSPARRWAADGNRERRARAGQRSPRGGRRRWRGRVPPAGQHVARSRSLLIRDYTPPPLSDHTGRLEVTRSRNSFVCLTAARNSPILGPESPAASRRLAPQTGTAFSHRGRIFPQKK